MEGPLVITLTLAFIGLIVALLVYLSWQTLCMYLIMRGWLRVPATALRARTFPMGGRNSSVGLEVEVEYELDGKRRRSWCGVPDRTGYNVSGMNGAAAVRKLVDQHSGGKPVTVVVNPRDHAEVFLRMPSLAVFLMMIGASILLPAAIIVPMFQD